LKKNKPIIFLLYSPLITSGGHSKNFINLVRNISKAVEKDKVKAIIVSYNNFKNHLSNNREKIKKAHFLNAYQVELYYRLFPSGRTIYQLCELIVNIIKTIIILIKNRPVIVYCYADMPLLITSLFKNILGFKLIYDMRGDIINEWEVKGKSKFKIFLLKNYYNFAIKKTDLIFSVSSTFRKGDNLNIVPKFNYYDSDIFGYNEKHSKLIRKELNLEDKFIFVYTGNAH